MLAGLAEFLTALTLMDRLVLAAACATVTTVIFAWRN
jgi:hypothetical protein